MKLFSMFFGAPAVVLLLFLSFFELAFGQASNVPFLPSTNVGRYYDGALPVPMELLQVIPIYSGASDLGYWRDPDSTRLGAIHYSANTDLEVVRAFYIVALSKDGWHIAAVDGGLTRYSWVDPQRESLWNLDLYVSYGSWGDSRTGVTLHYGYWPNLDNLPLYPAASRVDARVSMSSIDPTNLTVTLRYSVNNASSDDLRSYYESALTSAGWEISTRRDDAHQLADLHFVGEHAGHYALNEIGMNLYLTFHQRSDKGVLVEIQIVETEWSEAL